MWWKGPLIWAFMIVLAILIWGGIIWLFTTHP